MEILEVAGYGDVMEMKDEFSQNQSSRSFRDFGGVYLVHGRYLLSAGSQADTEFLSMVDLNLVSEFRDRIQAFSQERPGVGIELVEADFREPSTFSKLKPVDTSLLFEVLLHQENYIEILRSVMSRTLKSIHIAQPVLKEECFASPGSSTLLQFWPEDVKSVYRKGSFWPVEPRDKEFNPAHWMWGQTRTHFEYLVQGFGWKVVEQKIVTNVCGDKWDYLFMKVTPQ